MDISTEQIDPILFSEYLQKKGWKIFPRKEDYLKVFQYYSPDGEIYQVVIPLDRTLSDYDYTMTEAVETVALVEGKTMEQVVLSIQT